MRIISLASGSKGNACLVEHDGAVLLIDCGISCRELHRRLEVAAIEPDAIVAAVFTHSHDDHIRGVPVFHRNHPNVELFSNQMTAESIASLVEIDEYDFCCFENGQEFEIGPFSIAPFSIPHDTSDPVGYLIRAGGMTYFHGTDIGTPLDSIGLKLAEADYATLESNHDPVMLRKSGRPPSLVQRISGPRGHLSNDQAADLVRRFASPRLKCLALAHLSQDCNTVRFAEDTMRSALSEMERHDVELKILSQNEVVAL